jgi:hypothetical protein
MALLGRAATSEKCFRFSEFFMTDEIRKISI